jgi:hypothetical protein
MILLLLLACGSEAEPGVDYAVSVTTEPLDAPRLARRVSLDLRGVLPSTADLDAVEADPAALDPLRDQWLADPRFEERLVGLLAERWHTRVDEHYVLYYDYHLDSADEYAFLRAVGEEPLRLAARIAVEDRPWTEIATADHTLANELLASLWPLDYPAGATGWQEARYTDGRPAAGILSTNGLWVRYNTSEFNLSRSRAAATVQLLLCEDLLGRPVSFTSSPSVLDVEASNAAVQTDPVCLACHAAVEPLAAAYFGFFPTVPYNVKELDHYHPERELDGARLLGVEPAWFGEPVSGLAEVGAQVAADPRFDRCAAETAATVLWRRPVVLEDWARVDTLREAFVDADRRFLPLLRAVTDTPEYRAGSMRDDADEASVARERTRRLLPPDVLASAVEDLTGFRWAWRGWDQLANDKEGFRVMAGGVNAENVLEPQGDPGLTWALVTKRLAELAAAAEVERHFAEGAAGTLLDGVDPSLAPGDPAFDAALDRLCWRLLAVRADAARRDGLASLWTEVDAGEGPEAAWRAVLTALFRDPEFLGT